MFISPDIQPDGNVIGLLNEQKRRKRQDLFICPIYRTYLREVRLLSQSFGIFVEQYSI